MKKSIARKISYKSIKGLLFTILFAVIFTGGCSPKTPKAPNGFSIIEGDEEGAHVIKDTDGNEYVFIPCKELQRYDFANECYVKSGDVINRIYFGEESDESVLYGTDRDISFFLNSVNKHGGFYISRYEIGDEGDSKPNTEAMVNITRAEAMEICNSLYDQDDIIPSLVNSYAWDAAALYMMNGGEYIEHLGDNVSEYTTEHCIVGFYDDNGDVVVRGNNFNDKEQDCGKREYNFTDSKNEQTGFRAILYFSD